ncbi:ATP-grasp domain-containing protein [Pseudoalteromonas denitrificans]|uniref:ATP-grasp domain-containing protein n=1 Tax=Pseudoalteromonas denitrificans DSM 6059 TaxID=1123010 RepID=A0A1I1M509_9GAMM|nr:ATP-grasp domain-containing protein [Pseudoalteromonas denitrificans]SFC78268.1 ATP-grasp domain-containing protein [Pseudoalteromonas denitrificans DSM 6059]
MSKEFLLQKGYISLSELESIEFYVEAISVEQIKAYLDSSKKNIVACVPCTEPGVFLASEIAQAFNLPGNSVNTSQICRDKWLMRSALHDAKLQNTQFMRCHDISDVLTFTEQYQFPIVLKTPSGAGTNHVYLCHDQHIAEKRLDTILNTPNLFGKKADYALLESYIGGMEYIVNMFIDAEKTHLIDVWKYKKINTEYADFIYCDIILEDRSHLPFDVITYVENAIKAVGIERGVVHAEVKINSAGEAVLVELGSRIPGGSIPSLVSSASNFNYYTENLNVFLKDNYLLSQEIKFYSHCHVVFIPLFVKGKVIAIDGINEIKLLSSYVNHELYLQIGNVVEPTKDLQNSPIMVLLQNESKTDLLRDVDLTRAHFKVQLESKIQVKSIVTS